MRSVGVVVDPPFFDELAGLVEVGEQVLIQALVPKSAIEAFDKAIPHRFARRDIVPFDSLLVLPSRGPATPDSCDWWNGQFPGSLLSGVAGCLPPKENAVRRCQS